MVLIQFFKFALFAFIGSLMVILSLVRLGAGRHGGTGWEFLHLDWIFQPHLRYWSAHMFNLIGLMFGCLLCLLSLKILYRFVIFCKDLNQ